MSVVSFFFPLIKLGLLFFQSDPNGRRQAQRRRRERERLARETEDIAVTSRQRT